MPRNVRNFWLKGVIDGAITAIGGGPRAKNGGFTLSVAQRNEGSPDDVPLRVEGIPPCDTTGGQLELKVELIGDGWEIEKHGNLTIARRRTNR